MDSVITLTNQTNLFLTGVDKVINVCPTEIVLELAGKRLVVVGVNMEVKKIDLENKILIVDGEVNTIKFTEKKQGIFKRIFK